MKTPVAVPVNNCKLGQSSEMLPNRLYASVDEMLAPETLSDLIGQPVTRVRSSDLDHNGLSGARLLSVEATHGATSSAYVLKCMAPQWDWIMLASEDHRCRSVTLWQYGLLGRLQPDVEHAIVACVHDEHGWAILMHDVGNKLVGQEPFTVKTIKSLLKGLATLHAHFWQAPELADPALGLCDNAQLLTALSPQTMQRIPLTSNPFRQCVIEGWPLLQEIVAPDVAEILLDLMADPNPLVTALARYPATLVHGDYRSQNLGLAEQKQLPVTLLDWQLASNSAATIDLAWFLDTSQVRLSPISTEAAVTYYQQCLAHGLGNRFDESWWQSMWALGELAHVVRLGSASAWVSIYGPNDALRTAKRKSLANYEKQVRAAVRWL